MTSDERRRQLQILIDGHADTMAALRVSMQEIASINHAFERATAAFHDAGQGFARMATAYETALTASQATLSAAIKLLDDARGVN